MPHKRFAVFIAHLLVACFTACSVPQASPLETQESILASPTSISTPTPTPVGTWETAIDGVVYDGRSEPLLPVVGAVVRYEVLHSYFPELQMGRMNQTTTDEMGLFALQVLVHDTDRCRILIEAQGYFSHEVKMVGVDLLGGRSLDVALTPLPTATTVLPP